MTAAQRLAAVPAVREMTLDDLPELVSRVRDVAHESGWTPMLDFDPEHVAAHLAAMVSRDEFLVIGAEEGGALLIAQVASSWYTPTVTAHEKLVYVHPSLRRTGIGRALVQRYRDWARDKGVPVARIGNSVGIEPDKVRALYESEGFKAVGYMFEQRLGE